MATFTLTSIGSRNGRIDRALRPYAGSTDGIEFSVPIAIGLLQTLKLRA